MPWQSVSGPYLGPYVYVICSLNIVYVGETQKHPVIRWGTHLSATGGFRAKLAERGDPDLDYLADVKFIAAPCDWIVQGFPPVQWKTATQAVEHVLHEMLSSDPRILGRHLRVISDTEKTAPRTFRCWEVVRRFVPKILDDLRRALE